MRLTFANKLTIGRILVVPFFIATLLYYSPQKDYLRFISLAIFLLATITDVVDGYLARTMHEKTRAGAILDPLADKILLMSSYICLFIVYRRFDNMIAFPISLVVAVISRDAILLFGAMIIQVLNGKVRIVPNWIGKITAFLQMFCVVCMLLQWQYSEFLWPITVVATILSGILYTKDGIKALNKGA